MTTQPLIEPLVCTEKLRYFHCVDNIGVVDMDNVACSGPGPDILGQTLQHSNPVLNVLCRRCLNCDVVNTKYQ